MSKVHILVRLVAIPELYPFVKSVSKNAYHILSICCGREYTLPFHYHSFPSVGTSWAGPLWFPLFSVLLSSMLLLECPIKPRLNIQSLFLSKVSESSIFLHQKCGHASHKNILLPVTNLCLSHCSLAMKRHHDSYKRKHLIGACLQF